MQPKVKIFFKEAGAIEGCQFFIEGRAVYIKETPDSTDFHIVPLSAIRMIRVCDPTNLAAFNKEAKIREEGTKYQVEMSK